MRALKQPAFFIAFLLILGLLSSASALAAAPSPFGRKALEGKLSLGLHPSFVSKGNSFLFFTHLGYGLNSAMSLNTHFSLKNSPFEAYAGIDWRAALLNQETIRLDGYFGVHSGGLGDGLDAGIICNLDFFRFVGIILAIDSDILTEDNGNHSPIHLITGIDLPITRNLGLILSGAFGLNRAAYSGFSGGFIFFL